MKQHDTPETSTNVADAEIEFEFSRALISGAVPHASVQDAQARTWKRLSRANNRDTARTLRRVTSWQLSAVAALCTSTFVLGLWLGKHQQPVVSSGPRMSAEPLTREVATKGRQARELEVGQAHDVGEPPNLAGASMIGSNESSNVREPDKLSRVNSRAHVQGQGLTGASRAPTSLDAVTVLASEPASSVDDSVVLSAPTGGKNGLHSSWHNLANKGEYEAALVEIAQAGGYERVLASANPEQLMLLSDVARATGQQQRALAALRRIVNEHSNDPVAPLAALNMGNLLDKMGDGSGATQAFARYRALSPKGEFAEDALVRQLRSAVKAGQQALAQKLVHQYEADFPDGRSAGEVAQLSEQLPDIAAQADAGVPQP